MESLAACSLNSRFPWAPLRWRSRSSHRRAYHFRVSASREGPDLDKWDQMELKFGRLLGEDPKLTLAKIMARKADPNVSYLDVEKQFRKKKGKLDDSMLEIPVDFNVERRPSNLPRDKNLNVPRPVMNKGLRTTADLNLSRPVMNKGIKTTADLNLSRPVLNKGVKPTVSQVDQNKFPQDIDDNSLTPNVALRKPDVAQEDDIETNKRSNLKIKPNLFLKMRKDNNEDLSDVSLLKKPEVIQKPSPSEINHPLIEAVKPLSPSEMLRDKPQMTIEPSEDKKEDNVTVEIVLDPSQETSDIISDLISNSSELDGRGTGFQHSDQRDVETSSTLLSKKSANYSNDVSQQASLLGRPMRLDSSAKEVLQPTRKVNASLNKEVDSPDADKENLMSAEQEEREGYDWKRAEHLFNTGERAEVELVSCSGRGFIVSFGSLVGFLPYRNLGARWKFLAFESWLREKGLDPTLYRQNLSIIGSYDTANKDLVMECDKIQAVSEENEEKLMPGMKFEDLLEAYDREKTKFLSSFVGQRIKVSVLLADRNSRRLMFSGRPKEKEELIEKKRTVMAKLHVGDVVKCNIKKIAYFGIFVELEGVPALIHQSEISWDASMDPSSYYKIGQVVEAKVNQLDYALERITLSLKEITPDPLMEALDSVVGDRTSFNGDLEALQSDIEPWADVESLIEELQQIDEVQSVSKGRFFLSPGLAPTFQVYMASVLDNQYKLLARSGNKVKEVIVEASLDKEKMKAAILACTNRVE